MNRIMAATIGVSVLLASAMFLSVGISPVKAQEAPAYDNSADGLKKLMTDILAAVKADDKKKATDLSKTLVLSEPEKWFVEIFGDEAGKKVGEDYAKASATMADDFVAIIADSLKKERTEVLTLKIEGADDNNATGLQKNALKAMKKPVVLYTVKLVKKGEERGMSLWSFVYQDKGFKFIGKMSVLSSTK